MLSHILYFDLLQILIERPARRTCWRSGRARARRAGACRAAPSRFAPRPSRRPLTLADARLIKLNLRLSLPTSFQHSFKKNSYSLIKFLRNIATSAVLLLNSASLGKKETRGLRGRYGAGRRDLRRGDAAALGRVALRPRLGAGPGGRPRGRGPQLPRPAGAGGGLWRGLRGFVDWR